MPITSVAVEVSATVKEAVMPRASTVTTVSATVRVTAMLFTASVPVEESVMVR